MDVILGHPFYIEGSENVTKLLNEGTKDIFGGSFHVCETAGLAFAKIMMLLDDAREKLGINKKFERKLYDMKDRRVINV